jgi:hypothetical protein
MLRSGQIRGLSDGNGVAKHRRLGAVADHEQLRGVVRQTATVVSTAVTACILVAGLITVVLAGLDSAKHPAPQAPPPPSAQEAAGTGQSDGPPSPAQPTQGSNVAYYPTPNRPTRSPAAPTSSPAGPATSPAGPASPLRPAPISATLTPPAPSPPSSTPPSSGTSEPHSRHARPTNHRTKTRPPRD